ncbi:MAG TPA: hypothetical protein VG370_11660 [Chloroflexota bacterium]|jgi:uncharacterized protein YjdB|nr:hypothetical protein [Chloroflexota bacterium]
MRRYLWMLGFGLLVLLALGSLPTEAQTSRKFYLPFVAKEPTATPAPAPVQIRYRAFVQDSGWLPYQSDFNIAGTTDQGKRLEAVEFQIVSGPPGARIKYRAHVSGAGWQDWRFNGETAGSAGQTIEALQVGLENVPGGNYLVIDTFAQEWGWLGSVRDFWIAGTTGQARRLEAFRAYVRHDRPQEAQIKVSHEGYVESAGWQAWKRDPDYSGTTGQQLRLEAFRVMLYNYPENMGIEYRANVEGEWQGWVGNGAQAGTTGESKKINAIEMRLVNPYPGTILSYGAHFENRGWLQFSANDPSNNNPILGNPSDRLRLEAVRVGLSNSNP